MHWNNQSGMTILLIHSLFVILKALIKQESQEHQMAKNTKPHKTKRGCLTTTNLFINLNNLIP